MLKISNLKNIYKSNYIKNGVVFSVLLSPVISIVNAQSLFANIDNLVNSAKDIVAGSLTSLLMGVAFIAFLFSVISFMIARTKGDGDAMKDSKGKLLWTTVALFVMTAVWGLTNFIETSFLGDKKVRTIDRPQTSWSGGDNGTNTNQKDNGSNSGTKCTFNKTKNSCGTGYVCVSNNNKNGEIGRCVKDK